jgi:hypothetical protein
MQVEAGNLPGIIPVRQCTKLHFSTEINPAAADRFLLLTS